jgi:hypothetical protein
MLASPRPQGPQTIGAHTRMPLSPSSFTGCRSRREASRAHVRVPADSPRGQLRAGPGRHHHPKGAPALGHGELRGAVDAAAREEDGARVVLVACVRWRDPREHVDVRRVHHARVREAEDGAELVPEDSEGERRQR